MKTLLALILMVVSCRAFAEGNVFLPAKPDNGEKILFPAGTKKPRLPKDPTEPAIFPNLPKFPWGPPSSPNNGLGGVTVGGGNVDTDRCRMLVNQHLTTESAQSPNVEELQEQLKTALMNIVTVEEFLKFLVENDDFTVTKKDVALLKEIQETLATMGASTEMETSGACYQFDKKTLTKLYLLRRYKSAAGLNYLRTAIPFIQEHLSF